jgi:hypothetical protein
LTEKYPLPQLATSNSSLASTVDQRSVGSRTKVPLRPFFSNVFESLAYQESAAVAGDTGATAAQSFSFLRNGGWGKQKFRSGGWLAIRHKFETAAPVPSAATNVWLDPPD